MPPADSVAAADLAAVAGRRVVCSWSGGKDGALALVEAVAAGARPVALLTMLTEGGERSRSHGLRRTILEAQAAALGLPLVTRAATWAAYTDAFVDGLAEARDEHGAAAGVFGDIDIEGHRAWVHGVCARAGIVPCHPLWQRPRREVVARVEALGIRSEVLAVRDGVLPVELLGRVVDLRLADDVEALGADAAGEVGEYHSVVTAMPLFAAPLQLVRVGIEQHADVWYADLDLVPAGAVPGGMAPAPGGGPA